MINNRTLKLLKSFESLRLKAYPDPGSSNGLPWTIGYGHTNGVYAGLVCTEEQADAWLLEDIAIAEKAVNKFVKVKLNENQYGALTMFVHNIGTNGFRTSTLLKRVNAKRFSEVPAQLDRWKHNDGKVMRGLVRRRKEEGELFMLRIYKPLSKSRTVVGAATAGAGGAITMVEPLKELVSVAMSQQGAMSNGSLISLTIGGFILAGSLFALYARWDDAGRPRPW